VILGVAAALATPAAGQTSRIEGGSTTLGGFVFHYETRLEPPVPPLGDTFNMLVLTTPPSTVHRVMLDRTRKVYFGYDAIIGVGGRVTAGEPDERLYRITFGALTLTPALEKVLGGDAREWKLLPAPKFPDTRQIREGEVLELGLLNNDTWGQRMTEYVTILPPPRQGFDPGRKWEFVFAPGAPRDFTAADGVLRFVEPHVRATLRASDAAARVSASRSMYRVAGDVAGSVAWIYVPTRGRFLLSLLPRSEFRLAGSVRGTSLNFAVDGESYAVTSASPIAPGEAAFNLYVRHQPAWTPSYPNADLDTIHMGAADRLEYLVR
jgi:hypothetical protein